MALGKRLAWITRIISRINNPIIMTLIVFSMVLRIPPIHTRKVTAMPANVPIIWVTGALSILLKILAQSSVDTLLNLPVIYPIE